MATVELPPRLSRDARQSEVTFKRNKSSLELLMQMGFSKLRAEKALAATGDKGVQLASDWLLNHVDDPMLDKCYSRDYILYLCPVGQLQQELRNFWHKSFAECGWNNALNYFPHVTLCSFFKCLDNLVPLLTHCLRTVGEQHSSKLDMLHLEYFSSGNFIGLFTSGEGACLLPQITASFAEEAAKVGVQLEPHKKQLHLSLAYQFPTVHKINLESLAQAVRLDVPARWDLRLYSRDPNHPTTQTHRVVTEYSPLATDELRLLYNDLIYVPEEEIRNSADGWYKGTSWMTGCVGVFPGIYTERTAETETWTLHRAVPVIGIQTVIKGDDSGSIDFDNPTYQYEVPSRMVAPSDVLHFPSQQQRKDETSQQQSSRSPSIERSPPSTSPTKKATTTSTPRSASNPLDIGRGDQTSQDYLRPLLEATMPRKGHYYESLKPKKNNTVGGASKLSDGGVGQLQHASKGPRQLYVVRHGERTDFTFGKDWVKNSFDSAGNYYRYDLNMPKTLPRRRGGPSEFAQDPPLTVQGHLQAMLVGEALREVDVTLSQIYSSSSLRCVQTAIAILQGLNLKLPIHVEPGLFEWLGWYKSEKVVFMTAEEMEQCGYPVNTSYKPIYPQIRYNYDETTEQYYGRCYEVTKSILAKHESEGGNILILAHAASLDTCTRQLVGLHPRGHVDMHNLLHKIPYCAAAVCQESTQVKDTWYLIEPPVLPFAHTNNPKYNWTSLTSGSAW